MITAWFIVIAIVSAVAVYLDAKRLGVYGSVEQASWPANATPGQWALFVLLIWIVGLPTYLVMRPRYVRRWRADGGAR